jgi:hypothetical protein
MAAQAGDLDVHVREQRQLHQVSCSASTLGTSNTL